MNHGEDSSGSDGNILPSPFHRLVVVNQLRILEALYPSEALELSRHRMAVERGYVLHYDWLGDWLSEDEMSAEECREVLDILEMHRAMIFSWEKLPAGDRIERGKVKFLGFDGNGESRQFGYTVYFIIDLDRYPELWDGTYSGSLNSHFPMLGHYKKGLDLWGGEFGRSYRMSNDQLAQLTEAMRI